MKSIRFDNQKAVITYKTEAEAQKSIWIFYKHEFEKVTVEGNTVTFQYTGLRFLDHFLSDVFAKTCDDVRTEEDAIDKGTSIGHLYTIYCRVNRIFRITYYNKKGTVGKYGFGCCQYGGILSIENRTLTLRNSNLDEIRQTLTFDEDDEGAVLIEIGRIQF